MNFSGPQHVVQQGSHRISSSSRKENKRGSGLSLPYKGSIPPPLRQGTHVTLLTPHHQEPAQGLHLECRRLSNVAVFWAAIALVKYSITA